MNEKLTTISQNNLIIAENEQKVFEAGKKSMVDESKIIEHSVSAVGSVLLDDVSEIPHEIGVKVSSKNLLNTLTRTAGSFAGEEPNTYPRDFDYNKYYRMASNNYYVYESVSPVACEAELKDGVWTVVNQSGYGLGFPVKAKPNTIYTVSCIMSENGAIQASAYDKYGNWIKTITVSTYGNITTPENCETLLIIFKDKTEKRVETTFSKIQLEEGTVATDYTPYVDISDAKLSVNDSVEYIPDEHGRVHGIKSVSPNMSFTSNVENALLTVNYHKSWGMQTEYDRFWDNFQDNGNRDHYYWAFSYYNFTDETYNPKYPIICGTTNTSGRNLFYESDGITDTKVPIYFHGTANQSFYNAHKMKTIRELILAESASLDRAFSGCESLETLIVKGTIGRNGFNVQWSTKLSHDSIVSIINALSTTTSGLTVTLSKTAVNNAFETSEGAGDGSTSQEWLDLKATKSNWTITLV